MECNNTGLLTKMTLRGRKIISVVSFLYIGCMFLDEDEHSVMDTQSLYIYPAGLQSAHPSEAWEQAASYPRLS